MTFYDSGVTDYTVYGPCGINRLLNSLGSFAHRENLPKAVEFSQNTNESIQNFVSGPLKITSFNNSGLSNSFLFELPQPLGRFSAEKAKLLKIPNGPIRNELKMGNSITLEDGRLITPNLVLDEPPAPRSFLYLDFVSKFCWEKFLQNFEPFRQKELIQVIYHDCPHDLFVSSEYAQWKQTFTDCRHVYLGLPNGKIPNEEISLSSDSDKYIEFLSGIDPDLFPYSFEEFKVEQLTIDASTKEMQAVPQLLFNLGEKFKIEQKNTSGQRILKRAFTPSTEIFPNVIFLGTSAASPSKYRNVSCVMVSQSENEMFLLDCGEGSLYQMARIYQGNLPEKVKSLRAILISHLHADHHLGTISMIKFYNELRKQAENDMPELLLVAPLEVHNFIQKYSELTEDIGSYSFVDNYSIEIEHRTREFAYPSKFPRLHEMKEDGVRTHHHLHNLEPAIEISHTDFGKWSENLKVNLKTVVVDHCESNAFGFILTLKDGSKITYSGDTRVCENLALAGKDCTLLIHEATFEDDMEEDAGAKGHATVSQALLVAKKMNAKHTILTHLSARYTRYHSVNLNQMACLAFDFMQTSLNTLTNLPQKYEHLCSRMFQQEIEADNS